MAEKTKDQIIDELRQQVGALEVELKNTEQLARETKRHFARLIDSSTDAIISADKEGRVVLFNGGANSTGLSRGGGHRRAYDRTLQQRSGGK